MHQRGAAVHLGGEGVVGVAGCGLMEVEEAVVVVVVVRRMCFQE